MSKNALPDLLVKKKSSLLKPARNLTPTPQVQVEFCDTVPKSEANPPVTPSIASIEERKNTPKLRVAKKGASRQSKDSSGLVVAKKKVVKKVRATKEEQPSEDRSVSADPRASPHQRESGGLNAFVLS